MHAFVQPFGLRSPGGGARILRALLTAAPSPCLPVCTSLSPPPASEWPEAHLPTRPSFGRIERTRLASWLYPLERWAAPRFRGRLAGLCRERGATAIHGIAHAMDFWHGFLVSRELDLPFYLSVHDDLEYSLKGRPELREGLGRLADVWTGAAGRFVISREMGQEYCRRYGERPYEVVTDGLEQVAERPLLRPPNAVRIYFMGLFHWTYTANLKALLSALALLRVERPDLDVRLTMRCGSLPDVFRQPEFPVDLRPFGSEADVVSDMESADLLYLPLPFGPEYEAFVRYSLSTKMITYLGSGLPILYHGPSDAAAGRLLGAECAAVTVNTLDPRAIVTCVTDGLSRSTSIVERALDLGRREFMLTEQRRRFWNVMCPGCH